MLDDGQRHRNLHPLPPLTAGWSIDSTDSMSHMLVSQMPGDRRQSEDQARSRPVAPLVQSRESGFALVVVLWITGLAALIILAATERTQSFVRASKISAQSAMADALADAGVSLALIDLLATRKFPARTRRYALDGSPVACSMPDGALIVAAIQDAGGRVNINLASPRLLQALFQGLGFEPDAARRYAERIAEYRSPSASVGAASTATAEDTAAARQNATSLQYPTRHGPFDTVSELYRVTGLDRAAIEAIQDHVTLYSGTAGVDPAAAGSALKSILAKGSSQAGEQGAAFAYGTDLPAEFAIASQKRSFYIISEARLPSGAVFVREAVVDFPSSQGDYRSLKTSHRGVRGLWTDDLARTIERPLC